MATTGHVWRATRLNTRRNGTRHSRTAVLRSEKLREAALTAAAFGVAPVHDFVGAGAVPRSQRVVAFDDAVVVHFLPPLSSFDDEMNDTDGSEEGICRTCHAPVEEERRRWKVGFGLGFVRQVDELDSVRGVCRCDRKRYPEYGMEGDEVIVEEEELSCAGDADFSDTDEDDMLSNFAKAKRTLFPKPSTDTSDNMKQKEEKNTKKNFTNSNNPYSFYGIATDVDDSFSSESESPAEPYAPRLLIPRLASSSDTRQPVPTRTLMPRPSSSTAPPHSDREEESTVAQLKLPPSPTPAPIRRLHRALPTRPKSDPVTSAERRLRTLPPPCRRPAQRLSGSEAIPPPARTSSMSESVDGNAAEKSVPPPMSGGEPALARIATAAARSDKQFSQLTPPQGSPGEAAAICARTDDADFALPPSAAGLPGQSRPREGSACSQRSQRSTTRVLSVLAAEQPLNAPPSPEVATQTHPVRWISRSNRGSGLSAATAPGDVVLGSDDIAPGRLRFRSRRARTAEIPADRPLPAQGNGGADEVQGTWQQTDGQTRRRRPDAAPRERSFAGFNRESSLVSATGFEERREEFGAAVRPYMPRISKTDLGHLGHISPAISERRAQMMAREPVTQSRSKMASLRGLRVKMSRMMRSGKGGVLPSQSSSSSKEGEHRNGETFRTPTASAESPKKGAKTEKSAAKPPRDKVQKQLRLVVEKNGTKGEKNGAKGKGTSVTSREKVQKEKVQKQLRLVVERNQKSNRQSRTEKVMPKEKTKEQNGWKESNTG